jgi:hypothetical protein
MTTTVHIELEVPTDELVKHIQREAMALLTRDTGDLTESIANEIRTVNAIEIGSIKQRLRQEIERQVKAEVGRAIDIASLRDDIRDACRTAAKAEVKAALKNVIEVASEPVAT